MMTFGRKVMGYRKILNSERATNALLAVNSLPVKTKMAKVARATYDTIREQSDNFTFSLQAQRQKTDLV